MRLPKVLNICGHEYKIVYKKRLFYNGIECWGLCDDSKHVIYLARGMAKTRKMEIILHECIHAIQGINNIHLSEQAVKQLGIGILGLIRNNKLNFLQKDSDVKKT